MSTYEKDLLALGERVQKLERQNRRWKLGALLLALVFAASFTMAMAPLHASKPSVLRARTVETENLEIRNAYGKVLARFAANPATNRATIDVYSANGKVIWKAPGPMMVDVQ